MHILGAAILAVLSSCSALLDPAKLCSQTALDYGKFRDAPDAALQYADLFTPDGSFTLGGQVTQGRDALIARHQTSNQNQVWKHHPGVPVIAMSNGIITGTSKVIVQTGAKDGPMTTEITGEYADVFEISKGRCLIKTRDTKVTSRTSI